ncbi:aldehyde dehydrogenase [Tamlana fucoidanivorans]|uniref:Aldehyde dehydrogenase n=1 Tax=Allotamlana fucoidanivorans TaxID=2583814 RepID=A0A5C4SRS1_9FLAO|nr:aldehyde dehydrogenase [Tamlana fucoidanivorans]TNJ46509.1 aldehyde dehydrogenase [Tamlana fucoidanivorans]
MYRTKLSYVEHIESIVNKQRAFFKTHQTKSVTARITYLKALKSKIKDSEVLIFNALNKDFKKHKFETYLSEVGLVLSQLDLVIKKLKYWTKNQYVWPSLLSFPSKDYMYKEPYGSILVIAPWNYPFLLAFEPLIMAIAAGNTVVLKPSELTKNTSKLISQIIQKVFPEDWVIAVEGDAEVASQLLAQKWDFIFFTGSTKVGKIVAKAAAKYLTPVVLELGGKSPCIIDDTIDLKLVARRLVWGKLLNGGQTCIAPDYVIVKAEIKEALVTNLIQEITKRYGTDAKLSEDFPRIINDVHTKRLANLMQNQHIVFGGAIHLNSCFVAPTLIDNPKLDSPIMKEEIFGPILPILSFQTEKDIEHILWNLDKPLACYIFSKNKTFIKSILKTFSFGGGVINDTLIHFGNPKLPFGGVGASGLGHYHGKYGFDTFTHHKSIVKRGTWADPSFRYAPYNGKLKVLKKLFRWLG